MRRSLLILRRASAPWQTNGTWSIIGSSLVNTPTLGSELVTNGDMESGSPPSSWTATGTSTLTSVSDESTGGSGTKSLNALRGTTDNSAFQNVTVAVGTWYQFNGWLRNVDATNAQYQMNLTGSPSGTFATVTGTSWVNQISVFKITATGGNIRCLVSTSGNGRFDRVSLKPLTLNTLMAVRQGVADPASISATITQTFPCVAGVIVNLDSLSNPQNFVLGVHNGGSTAHLIKCVGGTYTNVLSNSVAFSAGATIEVRKTASSTYQLWYGGSQRGADQTISDAGVISNTLHGVFSTQAGTTLVMT